MPEGRLELLDVQPEMLAKAVRKFGPTPPPNLGWTAADAGKELPFEDDKFDLIVLVAVLGEILRQERALRSFFRILRPGGSLAVHEHLPDPDLIPLGKLRAMVEAERFRFRRSWGRRWNYTAAFEKPAVDI